MAAPKYQNQLPDELVFKTAKKALQWAANTVTEYSKLRISGRRYGVENRASGLNPVFSPADRLKLAVEVMKAVDKLTPEYRLILLYAALGDNATPDWAKAVKGVREQYRRKGIRIPEVGGYSVAVISLFSGQPEWWVEATIKDALAVLDIHLGQLGVMETGPATSVAA